MKFSAAMLKGFEMVDGRQCVYTSHEGCPAAPTAVCVWGAVALGFTGEAFVTLSGPDSNFPEAFEKEWGVGPHKINDEGMPWEHIYGMAVAAGL